MSDREQGVLDAVPKCSCASLVIAHAAIVMHHGWSADELLMPLYFRGLAIWWCGGAPRCIVVVLCVLPVAMAVHACSACVAHSSHTLLQQLCAVVIASMDFVTITILFCYGKC